MKMIEMTLHEDRHVTLTGYLQKVGGEFRNIEKRPAVLVLPGGAYEFCSERESDPVALAYLNAGYQAFILNYSVKPYAVWPNPLNDYDDAMAMIRGHADEWGVYADKIAAVGFSAGGHLAACAATMAKNRPDAAIIGYGVMLGRDMCGNVGAAKKDVDAVSAVDEKTPACFVFTVRTDTVVPIDNQFRFLEALAAKDISFETHIYSYGPHGFSVGTSAAVDPGTKMTPRAGNWVAESIGWLRELFGDFGENGMTDPVIGSHINADSDGWMSVDCSLTHLLGNPLSEKVVIPALTRIVRKMYGSQLDEAGVEEKIDGIRRGGAGKLTMRGAMAYAKASEDDVREMDDRLHQVINL